MLWQHSTGELVKAVVSSGKSRKRSSICKVLVTPRLQVQFPYGPPNVMAVRASAGKEFPDTEYFRREDSLRTKDRDSERCC